MSKYDIDLLDTIIETRVLSACLYIYRGFLILPLQSEFLPLSAVP